MALAQGKLAEALAVKGRLRDALFKNIASLFVVLVDLSGLIRRNCEFNCGAEGQVVGGPGGADKADSTFAVVVVDEVGIGAFTVVNNVHSPVGLP